jgi:hypothetical protein
MLLAAGRAAGEVSTKPADGSVGVRARDFELDVAVELGEAFVAADLRLCRAEQPVEGLFRRETNLDVLRRPASPWVRLH